MPRMPRIRRAGVVSQFPKGLVAVAPGSVLFHHVTVTNRSDVLIVGDSHTLICGAHFAYPECDVDARPGRGSVEALEILDGLLLPRHRVVVFEIATNDIMNPPGFAENLETLSERTGDRQLVLVNTWRRDGVNTHEHVNAALAEFAARNEERAVLVDWAAYVDGHRGMLERDTDYVHFSDVAYLGRIELVRAAIETARRRAPA